MNEPPPINSGGDHSEINQQQYSESQMIYNKFLELSQSDPEKAQELMSELFSKPENQNNQ